MVSLYTRVLTAARSRFGQAESTQACSIPQLVIYERLNANLHHIWMIVDEFAQVQKRPETAGQ